jgi:hypothetical protein
MNLLMHPRPDLSVGPPCYQSGLSDSTIGVTSEDDSDGSFPQEKTHHAEPGWGRVIEEPLLAMSPVMVVAVVFMIPVTLVVCPAPVVVVIVGVVPVCTRVWRPLPHSTSPLIPSAAPEPVAIDPGVAWTGHRTADLIAQRRRRNTGVYADLGKGWSRKCRSHDQASNPSRFHRLSPYNDLTYGANPA